MGAICLKSPASRLFTQPFIQAQIKENIKAPRHWPLWGESIGGPVNSPHKWPVTRKMFTSDDVIMTYCIQATPDDISIKTPFCVLFGLAS